MPTEDEAKAALARVKKGEDFAKVADEVSKDPGSQGGDLGWFTKDKMVPEFAAAAFKLEPGQVSDPVKSEFGWHVIKLEGKREKSFPALRSGEGSGGPLRRAEGAERRRHEAARSRQDRSHDAAASPRGSARLARCHPGTCARPTPPSPDAPFG